MHINYRFGFFFIPSRFELLPQHQFHYLLWRHIICYGNGVARSTHGGQENCVQVLVGRPEGKRPLVRLRRTWEDNIKMSLLEVG